MRKRIKAPKLLIMIQTLAVKAPADPKASFMTPEYVVVSPACVKRMRNSTETSASTATIRNKVKEGKTPRTLRTAGIDMIPEPIMLEAILSTAPGIEPDPAAELQPVKRGAWTPFDGGDIPAVEIFWES